MMRVLLVVTSMLLVQACNLSQGVKDTGEAIGRGAENIVEGVKQSPRAIGDAANKVDRDINDKQ